MSDTMLPVIRQLHDAGDDRARAALLLAMPDTILLKFAGTITGVCERARFQGGVEFVLRRLAILRAVRGRDGLPAKPLAADFEDYRTAFSRFASGGECAGNSEVPHD